MTSLHPHWSATDHDRHRTEGSNVLSVIPTVSRRPAAVVGILLVIGLEMSFVHGVDTLRAQLEPPQSIRITGEGLQPPVVTIRPGQEIRWINETAETPHIFTSDTLETTDGLLYTAHILPGSDLTVRVAPTAQPGAYTYISLTAPDVSGQIVVANVAAALQRPASAGTSTRALEQRPPEPTTAPPTIPTQAPLPSPKAAIPRNPYTVEGGYSAIPTTPIPPISPLPAQTSPLLTSPRPFHQPSTGPELWLLSLPSIAGLYLATRKIMRQG